MAGEHSVPGASLPVHEPPVMRIEHALQRVPFFRQLSVDQVRELARLGRIVCESAGHVVCHEGELSDSMYVLLTGKVSAYRDGTAGRRVDMRRFEEGDYFGEVALLDSKPRTATVVCVTECQLFVIEQSVFRDVLTANPSLVFSVLGAVADRAREQIEEHYQVELANLTLEAQAELQRHRSLTQMVAGVAHELNTPLGITNTAVDMIAARMNRPDVVALFETNEQTRQLFDNIKGASSLALRNITRAHRLIQDFKKISVDQLVDTPQREDLAKLVASTIDLFEINARRARLTISIDDQLPASNREWFGHPGLLTQVLMNLLANVERYAYEPGVGGPVDVVLAAADRPPVPIFIITVRDHGHGIESEDLQRVFDPFFTTGRSKGGTGLGLSIVRNIVTGALKGEISLDSTPGHGTTFQISFPQKVDHVQHQLAHPAR